MKKIILATMGLAMFATPLAAENPHSGYPGAERDRHTVSRVDVQTGAAAERFGATPSGMTQSFGLAAPGNFALSLSSGASEWPNQDLRDRYGRISR
ncbi:MAG: hypothetical protein ACOC9P_02965 [bacterium]